MPNDITVERMVFGTCKICGRNPAIYSNRICAECWEKKQKVVRKLLSENLGVGTEKFINRLKEMGVYY